MWRNQSCIHNMVGGGQFIRGRGGEGGRGGLAEIPSRDWKPTICQRQVGVARGCLDGLGKGLQGLRKAAVVIIAMRSRTPALLLAGF